MSDSFETPEEPELDDKGEPAPYQPGDRIVTLQAPWRGAAGTIVRQRRHYDGGETFWGNCVTKMDDGRLVSWNCWQLDREEGWRERADAKNAAQAAKLEAKERKDFKRLKAKYEGAADPC